MAKPKRERISFPVYFTSEERELLRKIAAKDKRDDGGQVRWLVTAYGNGELMTRGDAWAFFEEFARKREIPDATGTAGAWQVHDKKKK